MEDVAGVERLPCRLERARPASATAVIELAMAMCLVFTHVLSGLVAHEAEMAARCDVIGQLFALTVVPPPVL